MDAMEFRTDTASLATRLAETRFEARSDDETVTAAVDGSGQVLEIVLDPKAMRLDAQRLGSSIAETLRSAQNAARAALPGVLGSAGSSPDVESLGRLATDLGTSAQQRLSEISNTLDRLLARDATSSQA